MTTVRAPCHAVPAFNGVATLGSNGLKLIPDCKGWLLDTLIRRCNKLNDPERASQLLRNAHISKRVYVASLHVPKQSRSNGAATKASLDLITELRNVSSISSESTAAQESTALAQLASSAQVLIIYSLAPGRSSYSVFVEASPEDEHEDTLSTVDGHPCQAEQQGHQRDGCNRLDGDEARSRDHIDGPTARQQPRHLAHQARLFRAALGGILALPQPAGPGRLAFSGVPAHGAAAMMGALREAGYTQLWDEPCFRYSRAAQSAVKERPDSDTPGPKRPAVAAKASMDVAGAAAAAVEAAEASALAAAAAAAAASAATTEPTELEHRTDGAQEHASHAALCTATLPYMMDSLRTDADADLVNRHWTYRSPYSILLVRLLIATRHTVCARLPRSDEPYGNQAPGAAAAAANSPEAALATDCIPVAIAATRQYAGEAEAAGSPGGGVQPGLRGSSLESDAVAWILQYGDGSIGMAHTLEGHRRRGLMRLCVQELVQRILGASADGCGSRDGSGSGSGAGCFRSDGCWDGLADGSGSGGNGGGGDGTAAPDGIDSARGGGGGGYAQREVFAFIVSENVASIALFESLGFRRSPVRYHWFGVMEGTA